MLTAVAGKQISKEEGDKLLIPSSTCPISHSSSVHTIANMLQREADLAYDGLRFLIQILLTFA